MSKQFQSVKKIDFDFRKNRDGKIEVELIGSKKILGKTAWVDENDDLHLNNVTAFAPGEYTSKAGKQLTIGKEIILNQNWKNILQGKPLLDDHYKADTGLGSVKEVREENDGTVKVDLIVYNDELRDKVLNLELGALSVGGAIGDDGVMSFDHIAIVEDPACDKARFTLKKEDNKMSKENKKEEKDKVEAGADASQKDDGGATTQPSQKQEINLKETDEKITLDALQFEQLKKDDGVSQIELSKMRQELEAQKKELELQKQKSELFQLQSKATKLGVKFADDVSLVELQKSVDEHSKRIIMARFGNNKQAAERAMRGMNPMELASVLSELPTSKALNTVVDEDGNQGKSYEELTAERAKKMYLKEVKV